MKRTSRLSISLNTCVYTLIALTISSFSVGCAGIMRSPASGYSHRNAEPTFSRDRRSAEQEASLRELGFNKSGHDLSNDEEEAVKIRSALRRAERLLNGRSELEQYYKNKAYMKSDEQRLKFLQLESLEMRQRQLNSWGISGTSTPHPPTVQALIDINDITVGMTKQAVRESWGEPELVEVSGNPVYGNERWHFSEQTSSEEGYQTQRRLVYFESGRVIGWETR